MKEVLKNKIVVIEDVEIFKLISLGDKIGGNCADGFCEIPTNLEVSALSNRTPDSEGIDAPDNATMIIKHDTTSSRKK